VVNLSTGGSEQKREFRTSKHTPFKTCNRSIAKNNPAIEKRWLFHAQTLQVKSIKIETFKLLLNFTLL